MQKQRQESKKTDGSELAKKIDGTGSAVSQTTPTNAAAPGDFRIPRKKIDTTSLFRNIPLDSRDYQSEILPILTRHQSRAVQQTRDASFHYKRCTMISNDVLLKKFEEKRREMRQAKTDATITYGFWQTFSTEEVDSLCKNGVSSNYNLGTLGLWDKGVYVSQHSNLLTGAPLLDTVNGTFIIFKILKGRVKMVPGQTSGHLEPSPNYDCHAPKQDASSIINMEISPLRLFESNLLFLYDYVDVDVQVPPRNVCPIAIIEYEYRDRAGLTYWLKSELDVWTGSLQFEGQPGDFETNLRLRSHLAKMKPPYLASNLMIKKLVPAQSVMQWEPIQELRSEGNQGVLYKQRRDLRLNSGRYVSVFRLTMKNPSEKFTKFMDAMYESNTVGLASLYEGTAVLVFPQSHLSCQLGIPVLRETKKCLYCLVFAYRSMVTGTGFTRDPYETYSRVDSLPVETNFVQPKKFLEVTNAFVDLHVAEKSSSNAKEDHEASPAPSVLERTAAVMNSISAKSSFQSKAAPPVFPVAGADALLRDPRILKRMHVTEATLSTGASANKTAVTPVATSSPPPVQNVEKLFEPLWEQPPVDLEEEEEPCQSVEDMDINDQEEPDETPDASYQPKIMPLENIEDAESSMEHVAASAGAALLETSRKHNREAHGEHQDGSFGQCKTSIMDNAILKIIYGTRQRENSNADTTVTTDSTVSTVAADVEPPLYDPAQSPMSDLPLVDEEVSMDSAEDMPATAPKASSSAEPEPENSTASNASASEILAASSTETEDVSAEMDDMISTMPHGIIVPDDLVLTKADPEQILKILAAFQQWKNVKSADWRLKLHSQVVLKLSSTRNNLAPTSIHHQRAATILMLCQQFRESGVVELLKEHECDKESRSAAEYLPCLQKLKGDNNGEGHCIFLTNMNAEGTVAKGYLESDILVMNLKTLLEDFLQL